MKNSIEFKGQECKAERVGITVKKGAYEHKSVKGWQLVDKEGNVVINGHPGNPKSAYEYQQPKYKTRKELLEDVDYYNECWREREARKGTI